MPPDPWSAASLSALLGAALFALAGVRCYRRTGTAAHRRRDALVFGALALNSLALSGVTTLAGIPVWAAFVAVLALLAAGFAVAYRNGARGFAAATDKN